MNLLFAWRYFKGKKSTQAINWIAWISTTAIVLITAAFILLLSVFNGFEGLVKSLYSSFYADLKISSQQGSSFLLSPEKLRQIRELPGVKACSGIVEQKALLAHEDLQTIVYLKGVDDAYSLVSGVDEKLIRGSFQLGTQEQPAIVLGGGVENILAVDVERSLLPLTLYVFQQGGVSGGTPTYVSESIRPSGTFFIQQDIDGKYALTNIASLRRMLNWSGQQYSSLELAVSDPQQGEDMKGRLEKILGAGFRLENRYQQNSSLYQVMRMEKWAIYLILTFMLGVAAFTLVGALTMLVMEKQKDIQVLKAMGSSSFRIQKIFLSLGLFLGVAGGVLGLLLGLVICWAQLQFKLVAIQGGTFLIDYYPVSVQAGDLFRVGITVIGVATLASWLPSVKAAQLPIQLKSL